MEWLYWDLGSVAGGGQFEVKLRGSIARVCLMDRQEYEAYCEDEEYDFFGGFTDVSPVVCEVPYDDYWFLVVDSYSNPITVEVAQVVD